MMQLNKTFNKLQILTWIGKIKYSKIYVFAYLLQIKISDAIKHHLQFNLDLAFSSLIKEARLGDFLLRRSKVWVITFVLNGYTTAFGLK